MYAFFVRRKYFDGAWNLLGGICLPKLSNLEVEVIKEFFQENAVPGKRVEATPSKKGGVSI